MSSRVAEKPPVSAWRKILAGLTATVAFAFAVLFAVVRDIEILSPAWRTGLAMLGACIGAYSTFWAAAKPAWRTGTVKVVWALISIVFVAGATIFLTPSPPAAPDRLLGDATSSSVRLTWPASADDRSVRAYEVYRGRGSDRVTVYSGRQTFCVDTGVQPGQVYDYVVVAVGDGGRSTERPFSIQTTKISSLLQPPPLLKAQAVSAESVLLTWVAPAGASENATYVVIRDGGKMGEVNTIDFVDNAVQPDTSYSYTVRTFDPSKKEESRDSMSVSVHTPALAPVVVIPSPARTTRTPAQPTPTLTVAPPPPPPPTTPPAPSCSGDLTEGGWHLAAIDDADEVSEGTPDNVLQGRTSARIKFNLHGLDARTGADDGVVIFNQDNDWFTANLAVWGTNGLDGTQTVTIPLAEFRRVSNGDPVDTNDDVPAVRARFWHEDSWAVDIYSIVVCS